MNQLYRGENPPDQLFVKVFEVATVTIDRDWNYQNVCSGFWRFYVSFASGAALDLPDGTRHELTANRIHFVPAWVRFSCRNTGRVPHFYVHFDLIGMTGVAVQRMFHKPLTLPANPRLLAAARQLTRQLRTQPVVSPPVLCQTKALVYTALAQLLPGDALPAAPLPVSAALQHIETHLGTLMTNAQLAGLCHFSEDHFVRLFRQHLGQTPAQYVLERRIATATNQLAFTTDSIEQIAANLGFANRYHLTKMFSRRMGVSPAAYRKQTRV